MRETLVKTEEFKDSPVGRIPKDWEFVSVADIAIDVTDGDHHTPERSNSGIFLLSARNILNGGLALEDVDFVPEHEYQRMIRRCHPEPGDILISCSGTIGRVCEVPENFRCVLVRSAALVKLDKTRCRSRFIEAVLQSGIVQTQILMEQLQAAQPNLFQNSIKRLSFPLPPVHEQERIAEILDTVEKAIAHTYSLIAKLKQMKAGLLHDLLTRGLDENGELRDAIAHSEQFKDSPLGQIPKDWDTSILDKIISIIDCKHYTPKYASDGIPIVRPRNVKIDGLDFSDIDYVLEKEYKLLTDKHTPKQGDIVFSRNASFGIPCYVDTTQRFAIGQDVVIMTELSANTRFVYYTLISDSTEKQIQNVSAGSTFGRINLACIRELVVPVPPRKEQERIAEILDTYDSCIRTEEVYREKLKLQKQGLMHDLLTGKVRVKNA